MNTQQLKVDGYSSFSGGMDSSRGPSIISSNQYVYSVNCILPKESDGIATRKGFRCIAISFSTTREEEIFRTGNFQASGHYTNYKNEEVLVYVIDGYFFELTGNKFKKNARILNTNDQNDPNQQHNYITTIPFGVIINDGYSAPFFTNGLENRRSRPSNREIPAGLMGAYIQNRFWFVRPNRREIWSSTIKQPLSLDEAIIDNIYGITCPEEDQRIVAIGKQGTSRRDAISGNLCFATNRDFYSADVRGARTNWGLAGGQGSGFVENTVPGMGAVSHNSFEQLNANIFYRNPVFGLISLNQSLADFSSIDGARPQTIEASLFFDKDTKEFLDSCYTRKYKKSLLTTVAPKHRNGFVYWNGIIVKTPDPYYGKQSGDNKFTDIVESVFTGIRPWDIQTIGSVEEQLVILSYDKDGVNRLYMYDETINHDIRHDGTVSQIESKILTRSFDFNNPLSPKITNNQLYSLSHLNENTNIKWFSRNDEISPFSLTSSLDFEIFQSGGLRCNVNKEARDNISIPSLTGNFYTQQDLVVFTGSATIRRMIKTGTLKNLNLTSYKEVKKIKQEPNCHYETVFSYTL